MFCQDKLGGVIRLLTDLRKLNEILESYEWPIETIDIMLNNMVKFNWINAVDQAMMHHEMQE